MINLIIKYTSTQINYMVLWVLNNVEYFQRYNPTGDSSWIDVSKSHPNPITKKGCRDSLRNNLEKLKKLSYSSCKVEEEFLETMTETIMNSNTIWKKKKLESFLQDLIDSKKEKQNRMKRVSQYLTIH